MLIAKVGPGTGGVAAELGGRGLIALAVGLRELQLIGHLPKLGGAKRAAAEGDPAGLGLLALEVHGQAPFVRLSGLRIFVA